MTVFLVLFLPISLFWFFQSSQAACSTATGTNIRVYGGDALVSGVLNLLQATETDKCISGSEARLNIDVIPTMRDYEAAKSVYYTQNKSTKITKKEWTGDQTQASLTLQDSNKDQIDHVTGNLTLTGNITGGRTRVILVDGNLLIDTFTLQLATQTATNGLVFLVKGNTYLRGSLINPSTINAFLISYGQFCDYSDPIGTACPLTTVTGSKKLTINGSVIYLNSDGSQPKFVRGNANNTEPAEEINYQPKYLVILKDIFAKDLSIWREIQ